MTDHAAVVREAIQFYDEEKEWDALAALDALVAERDEARRTAVRCSNCAAAEAEVERCKNWAYSLNEERLAAEAERDRLIAERQRLTDENDKGVRALWDEKNKFMEALEVEMVEKKALIAERERLRDEIDADCVRIVAAEAERDSVILAQSAINAQNARLREALGIIDGFMATRCKEGDTEYQVCIVARAALGDDA